MIDGQRIVVDQALIQQYGGFKVEYAESWFGEGFYVRARIGISSY